MKIDSQRRLNIPAVLLEDLEFQLPCKVRLAVKKDRILLIQHSEKKSKVEYHDVLIIDNVGRVIIKKHIMELAGIDDSTEFVISAMQDYIIIRWKK